MTNTSFDFLLECSKNLSKQNSEYSQQILELQSKITELLETIFNLRQENSRLQTELQELKHNTFGTAIEQVEQVLKPSKEPKKSKKSKRCEPMIPPPNILHQMKRSIALLNKQNGTNLSLNDFDVTRIESE